MKKRQQNSLLFICWFSFFTTIAKHAIKNTRKSKNSFLFPGINHYTPTKTKKLYCNYMAGFPDRSTSWLVIGGGPCGIASVGKLVDEGFSVLWVDNRFQAGRMGEFYENVPANTENGDLLKATRQCDSFEFEYHQKHRRDLNQKVMSDLESDKCFDLKYLVDALHDATTALLKKEKVTSILGRIESIEYDENTKLWEYTLTTPNNEVVTGFVHAIINTCGSRPKPLPGFPLTELHEPPKLSALAPNKSIYFHSLDRMVDPLECKQIVSNNLCPLELQRWIIIGDSHSGILIVKNLIEAGIVDVINVHKSPLRFMYTTPSGKKK